jgi:undecaprenyl pyrophosphate phosphatase UppP
MSIREIIAICWNFWKNIGNSASDWVLDIRITWDAVQLVTIAVGVCFLLVVVSKFLDKFTEYLTEFQKISVLLALGFFLVLVPFWLVWLD